MSNLGKAKPGGKRPPEPGEVRAMSTDKLLALYRKACERLRDAGHWQLEPLASQWARALSGELCDRGHHAAVLAIESEVRGDAVCTKHTRCKPTGAGGRRKRWEV